MLSFAAPNYRGERRQPISAVRVAPAWRRRCKRRAARSVPDKPALTLPHFSGVPVHYELWAYGTHTAPRVPIDPEPVTWLNAVHTGVQVVAAATNAHRKPFDSYHRIDRFHLGASKSPRTVRH